MLLVRVNIPDAIATAFVPAKVKSEATIGADLKTPPVPKVIDTTLLAAVVEYVAEVIALREPVDVTTATAPAGVAIVAAFTCTVSVVATTRFKFVTVTTVALVLVKTPNARAAAFVPANVKSEARIGAALNDPLFKVIVTVLLRAVVVYAGEVITPVVPVDATAATDDAWVAIVAAGIVTVSVKVCAARFKLLIVTTVALVRVNKPSASAAAFVPVNVKSEAAIGAAL